MLQINEESRIDHQNLMKELEKITIEKNVDETNFVQKVKTKAIEDL